MLNGWINNLCNNLSDVITGMVAGVLQGRRSDRGAHAPRPHAEVRPAFHQTCVKPFHMITAIAAALLFIILSPLYAFSASQGDQIINSAQLNSSGSPMANTSVNVNVVIRTPSHTEFLKYAPGATPVNVDLGAYHKAGDPAAQFTGLAQPALPINLPNPVPLTAAPFFHPGEPVFVRVTDLDQNLDRTRRETVFVTVTDSNTGDSEVVLLTETGPDTGVFVGYIPSIAGSSPAPQFNGTLSINPGDNIGATYTDIVDPTDVSHALVDPFGVVFNSSTGAPIDGVRVTLYDVDHDIKATVLGEDGVSIFPSTVTTGGHPTDTSGRSYDFPPGGFHFPSVPTGNYRFIIEPPDLFAGPSALSYSDLNANWGESFIIANPGSKLEPFAVNAGPPVRIDIPLDPGASPLWLTKSAGKDTVAVGDFLAYELDIQNNEKLVAISGVAITDTLPLGFRFRKGSVRINGTVAPDPAISADGRTLTFNVGDLAPLAVAAVRYVVEVAAGAKIGIATNLATARSGSGIASNLAKASVQVKSDFLSSRSILMGRVGRGPCNLDWDEGVEGVRIYMEDGTFVNTDKRGMFHFEGMTPGTHVVQLDLDSLPEGFEVYNCEENTRFAGRSFSQFVDVQGGSLWRTDFRVGRPDDVAIYEKKIAERKAAELKATEAARKAAEKPAKDAQKKAQAAKEEEAAENAPPAEDWPAEAPKQAAAPTVKEEKEEAHVDDWAAPVAVADDKKSAIAETKPEKPAPVAIAVSPQGPSSEAPRIAATLQLMSALEQGGVVVTPAMEVSRTALATGRLEVELPDGLLFRPGSATRDGISVTDPDIHGKTLAFTVGSAAPDSRIKFRFAADFTPEAVSGEYITRAVLLYTTDKGTSGRTSYADNVLVRIKEEEREALPSMAVYPKFETFADEVGAQDKKMLEETVQMIRVLKERHVLTVRQLLLVGHTDNLLIARRSRHIHRDNRELSIARAKSVALYLKEQLGLTPAQISASGRGESAPVANNRTEDGRARNRRVEVIILTEQVVERVKTTVKKDKSDVQRGELPATPAAAARATKEDSAAISTVPADAPRQFAIFSAAGSAAPRPDFKCFKPSPRKSQPASSGVVAGLLLPVGMPASLFAPVEGDSSADAVPAAAPADSAAGEPEKEEQRLTTVGILSPADGARLPNPISAVRVVLDAKLTPQLVVDGVEIPSDRIGFTLKDNKTEKTLYSYIGVNFGDPGQHKLTLTGKDPFGIVRFEKTATITRTGAIAKIRFVSAEGNMADGKTPVRMKLELFDAAGVAINAPTELQIVEGTLRPLKKDSLFPDSVQDKGDKGDKLQVDADGYALFQPVNASGLYRTVLSSGKTTVEAETYVKPMMREWILVGLGEGNVGYNAVAGHIENLRESDQEEHFYDNERLAFYAKGKVKGEWLLTMSYDSAKGKGVAGNTSLFQNIDPNTYYTLYGDTTQQQYDAASARKIYLKIERDQFYAMFGDFDTNLTVTELSRYSRRMNGGKAEYQGKNLEANVFGTETAQAYARDEIRGDGTSGLYHLSRKNIVLNSDKITIETRDRFHSEIIITSVAMNRFTDYSIDYDTGALFFKQPIYSRDENFNPIFIVAEYETNGGGSQAYTYGGRVGAKLFDQKLKAGFTYIHEGQVSGNGNSYGLDAKYKIMDGTTLKGEVARTDTRFGNLGREGNAYLAELEHRSKNLEGKVYIREQDEGFGLGQQNGSETGTRKGGIDAAYKFSDSITLGGQAYRQYNLSTGGVQDVAEGKVSYTLGPYSAHLGLRHASDKLGDGTINSSEQITMGGSWLTLNKRLTLRVDHDQSIGGNNNISFPTRTSFGADFKLTQKVSLFAQQEITSGSGANTNTTSAGMKANPWEGASLNTSMGQNLNENGDRMFALFGLKQTWKITDNWSVDGGLDRSQTIKNSKNYTLNVNVPPASGDNQDFTAVSLGTTYTEKKWNLSNRLEVRTSDTDDKWGIVSAFVGEPKEGWGWSARCQIFDTKSAGGAKTVNGDLRLGMVYRPLLTNWIVLDRLDFLYDKQTNDAVATTGTATTSFNSENRRVVNNLSANYKLDNKTQISLLYGAKYVLETIDGADYSGFTDLVGVEGRYDLTKKWDIGLRGSVLHSWNAGQLSYSAGPSVGYNVMQNAWVSLGYNLVGFSDKEFSAAEYTAQGPFARFRFKFDQNSVKDAVAWINHL